MIPSIELVLYAEMLRDGGSLGAAFHCPNSAIYGLLFKVDLVENASGEIERKGYLAPGLFDAVLRRTTALSWRHAEIYLHQIRRLARRQSDFEALDLMTEVAERAGVLPLDVKRVLGRPILGSRSTSKGDSSFRAIEAEIGDN